MSKRLSHICICALNSSKYCTAHVHYLMAKIDGKNVMAKD